MNTFRPKQPRRSIQVKDPEGRLQNNQEELATISGYFENVFSSQEPPVLPQWNLQSNLDISHKEVRSALDSLSSKKALPPGQAPIRLWQECREEVVTALRADFQQRFVLAILCLLLKPRKPTVIRHWLTYRLAKGVYRRRATCGQPQEPPACKYKPVRSSASPANHRLLWALILLALVFSACSMPAGLPAGTHISTQHSQGLTLLHASKTSFPKAQRQALAQGYAQYGGLTMSCKQLGVQWTAPKPPKTKHPKTPKERNPNVRVVTWNCGGLNSSRHEEVQTQLKGLFSSVKVDRLIVQPESKEPQIVFSNNL